MGIKFFKTMNYVLFQGIADICRYYKIEENEAISKVKDYLKENSSAYYSDDPKLEYENPLCRIAYVYAYVAAHANLIDNAFYKFENLKDYIKNKIDNNGTLKVCSLGGGPGSELLGFVKFIERERKPDNCIDVNFSLIDNISEWDETWQALANGLDETFKLEYGSSRRDWPVIVHRSFLPLNLCKPDDFQQFIARFSDVDIYVLNHTVSELLGKIKEFKEVFNILVQRASNGAYFLFIDRDQTMVLDIVKQLLKTDDLVAYELYQEEKTMDWDEQKIDLGKWYEQIEWTPKLKWKAFYALAEKYVLPF